MSIGILTRRTLLKDAALALAASAATTRAAGKLHVACSSYSWDTFYAREKRSFSASLDDGLADVARSGLNGFEPGINAPEDLVRLTPLLRKHGLEIRSLYVNSALHKPEEIEASISRVLDIARKAKGAAGTQIIVTNPSPIRWGGPEDKDDSQLKTQAAALDRLGSALRPLGLTLAYHNHDIELRKSAREFHHMMLATNPKNVTLCLDAHWVYRGCGNSSVALFDVVKLYGARISELHLRQSVANVWSETFGEGDIDYPALAAALHKLKLQPHLVLEQAPEKGTPQTIGPVEIHRLSRQYVDRVFGAL